MRSYCGLRAYLPPAGRRAARRVERRSGPGAGSCAGGKSSWRTNTYRGGAVSEGDGGQGKQLAHGSSVETAALRPSRTVQSRQGRASLTAGVRACGFPNDLVKRSVGHQEGAASPTPTADGHLEPARNVLREQSARYLHFTSPARAVPALLDMAPSCRARELVGLITAASAPQQRPRPPHR